MVRLVKRKRIDENKYQNCIENSQFPSLYARYWYLDVACGTKWDCLVLNDYEAVMPVPYSRPRSLFFKKVVCRPPLCQQLGIFQKSCIKAMQRREFFLNLFQFKILDYPVHHKNEIPFLHDLKVKSRTNLVLPLTSSYVELQRGYSKSLRKNIRRLREGSMRFEMVKNEKSVSKLIDFYVENAPYKIDIKRHRQILASLMRNEAGHILIGKVAEDWLVSCFIGLYKNRIYILFGRSSEEGKNQNAMHGLIDYVIENYASQNYLLDFEGSDIPGVRTFFESFGAYNEGYSTILN